MKIKDAFNASRVIASLCDACDKSNVTNWLNVDSAAKQLDAVTQFLNQNPLPSLIHQVETLAGRIGDISTRQALDEIKSGIKTIKRSFKAGSACSNNNYLYSLREKINALSDNAALNRSEKRELNSANKYLKMVEEICIKESTDKVSHSFQNVETPDLALLEEFDETTRDDLAMEMYGLTGALIEDNLKGFFQTYNQLPSAIQQALNQEIHRRGGCICDIARERNLSTVRSQVEKTMLAALALAYFIVHGEESADVERELAMMREDLLQIKKEMEADDHLDSSPVEQIG